MSDFKRTGFSSSLLATLIVCAYAHANFLHAQDSRMVIGTNVVCRAQPSRNAAKVVTLRLGEIRGLSREARGDGGVRYFDEGRPSCWVPGALTAEFVAGKPESALLAAADHILQRKDPVVTFGEYVEAENLLLNEDSSSSLQSSGLRIEISSGLGRL